MPLLGVTGTFFPDQKIHSQLTDEDGVWLSSKRQDVTLKVEREIAGYFKRRKLIDNQVIQKELLDGGLLVSVSVGHINQLLPIIRYWIPHIRIVSPSFLQDELEQMLRQYLN